jgi:hypothetical protein
MPDESKPAGRKRGPKPRGEVAMSGAERNRLYRERKKAARVKERGMPTPSIDLDRLREVLKESRYRLSSARTQVEWLHEEIGDFLSGKYPPEITGPAFQIELCLVGWQEMIDKTEALLPRRSRKSRDPIPTAT